MNRILLSILVVCLTTISCKKEKNYNDRILGKWKLVEIYDGYLNGGKFQWNNIPNESSHTLIFNNNGQYILKEDINGNYSQCNGTYILKSDYNLELNSNCNYLTEKMKISEIQSSIIIIDRNVIEGTIRYKYILIE